MNSDGEKVRNWNAKVTAYFKVISSRTLEKTEENHKQHGESYVLLYNSV
jgi:hypothetical protein